MNTVNVELDELCINTIRFLSADAVEKAKSGHPGTPMGLAPLAYVLWTRFLKHNPRNPKWMGRDHFILSAGHASMLLYSLLYLTGYDVTIEDIKQFRQWKSRTPGHPEYGHTPGVEVTTGPLGQGFGIAVGMAIAQRFLACRFNNPDAALLDNYIYCICSDGDLMEGVASEAASLAGHLGLGRLIYFYDDNRITIEGSTDLAFAREDVRGRFEAYGWQVLEVPDGNDIEEIARVIVQTQQEKQRPSLIIVKTHIGFGSPNKQDTAEAHGAPLGAEELQLTKKNLGWPLEPLFYVPKDVLAHYRKAVDRGEQAERDWEKKIKHHRQAYPQQAALWQEFMGRQLPEGWDKDLPVFKTGESIATRSASGKVINALAGKIQNLFGGSADLAPSTDTFMKDQGDFLAENHKGRNLHFGVREHAMGAILNGMQLHGGVIPFGATFLIFSDYMRPAIRLAALMDTAITYVFTHDSIGLGEDGPTHQPIEHLMSLRAIPNVIVLRPGDANETREAWRYILTHRKGPVALVLTRQKLPVLDVAAATVGAPINGAYVLQEAEGPIDLILIATGSEVSLAVKAREKLKEFDIQARVVSMPSQEIFEEQPQEYRDKVLPPGIKRRISVEAGVPQGWERYVGYQGKMIAIDRFGASAPGEIVMDKLGFNVENIVHHAKVLMQETS